LNPRYRTRSSWQRLNLKPLPLLMRFLIKTAGGKQTGAFYVTWASKTEGAPSMSTLQRGGRPGFAAMCNEAAKRLRRGDQPVV
jgi:hypothetical protein